MRARPGQAPVPTRAITATIGMVLATAAILLLGWEVRRVLTWIVVIGLLSVVPVTQLSGSGGRPPSGAS